MTVSVERRAELVKRQQFAKLYRETYNEEPAVFLNALRHALGLGKLPCHAGFGGDSERESNEKSVRHFLRALPDGNRHVRGLHP